jgi:hypothetical protein
MKKHVIAVNGIWLSVLLVCPGGFLSGQNANDQNLGAFVIAASARFGSGPDELGHCVPQEANPEGPMSFALGDNDTIYILDQLNARVQVFAVNRRVRTVPIPANPGFKDIALTGDGKIVLLDTAVQHSVYLLAENGEMLGRIPLAGELIPRTFDVGGVFYTSEGIWVETGDRSVLLADGAGIPKAERVSVSGKYACDGKRLVSSRKIGDITAVVRASSEDTRRWQTYHVYFENYLCSVNGLETDSAGHIYLEATLREEPLFAQVVVVLDASGREIGRIDMYVSHRPEEIFRDFRVSPDGRIFQMALDDEGVAVRKYDVPF